jgi:hypothetical protein
MNVGFADPIVGQEAVCRFGIRPVLQAKGMLCPIAPPILPSISRRALSATCDRARATEGLIFVLHDTTEFTYQGEAAEAIGVTKSVNSGRDKAGRVRSHTVCGILMHSSLALTAEGVPLGLAAVKIWTRQKFKGTASLKNKINPTRIPIEMKESIRRLGNLAQSETLGGPDQCVHIGDRGN